MKKIRKTKGGMLRRTGLFMLAFVLLLQLTGCGSIIHRLSFPRSALVPETVELKGETYRTAFYSEDLWPHNLDCSDERYDINGISFHRVTV